LLDNAQVVEIVTALEEGRMATGLVGGFQTHREHLASLADRHDGDTCPKCGGHLVERQAKRGENAGSTFIGCSGYPICRYTPCGDRKTG
jgi:restriction system protein